MSTHTVNATASLSIISPGTLSLIQDAGRFGMTALGLTQGGPVDAHSFAWANALVGNPPNSPVIEHSIGGLIVRANNACTLALTGAELPVKLNGQTVASWQALTLNAGDELELGYMTRGLRVYLAVAGGFAVTPQFGSSATVMREGIGGLHQNGSKLAADDLLPIGNPAELTPVATPAAAVQHWTLPPVQADSGPVLLRLLPGYQAPLFSATEQARFFVNPYQVSPQCDRMGYKLSGSAIHCNTSTLLSEGISLGAVQIPPDGQPIVLLNDRQTLGGYPKIGTVLSLDCWKLAQCPPGTHVHFQAINSYQSHNALALYQAGFAPSQPPLAGAQDER
jgi:biotin-dependent carboxylase-like uncharacterized protein